MITFSTSSGSACSVSTGSVSFAVFPSKASKDAWALLSHPEEQLTDKKWVSWPGEYDFAGMSVRGVGQEGGRQVSFLCTGEGVRMAFVDGPVLDWTDAEIERMGEVDVLCIAADQPKKVLALVESIDPRVIVLFSVKSGDLAGTAKACGLGSVAAVAEFKVKPGSLPQDSRQVVVLG
jgi:hypothetical protein